MEKSTNSNRTLMAVLAHPDDESFGMGGTLALYAQRGVAVHLVCATRGEVGDVAPEFLQQFGSVAECRMCELDCAAKMLGLAAVHYLDYRDSGMAGSPENLHPNALANAPLEAVAAKVARQIRQYRPQVVVTFDPIGGYRHPDHIAIHNATLRAFDLAGEVAFETPGLEPFRPQKLYFHTFPKWFFRTAVRLMPLLGKDPRRWGRNGDIDLTELADVEFPAHAVIDCNEVLAEKMEAAACHASQGGQRVPRGLLGWVTRLQGNKEVFTRAYPAPTPRLKEKDLFAGLI
jgi:LmbE family N-acetylglucosaminyl deacetylase